PEEIRGGFHLHYFLLYEIVLGLEVKEALELGAGRSTLMILDALETTGGHLTTCALNYNGPRFAGLDESPHWTRVDSPSDHFLKTVPDSVAYDFVLHDGSHERAIVHRDLQQIVPHMRQFGMILVHDTQHDKLGKGMAAAVQSSLDGVAHSCTTLPYGFGLTLIRIEEDLGHGSISLTRAKRGTGAVSKPFTLPEVAATGRDPSSQTLGEWLRHAPGKILRPEFRFRK
ncbi:MAG: class I SAM-dependent methyltransferase, partial [Gemmatimonadetes bacterium]|nr:class I SAM-dependent methyltransferase [Gemmatimonadota bacterium]